MGTILENTTQSYSDGDQITSTNLNNLLSEATFKSTAVDQSSVTLVGGKIALPSSIPTRSFTSPTLNSPTVEGTFTVNASSLGGSGVIIESEGIASNDNDTSLPTSAAVKDYVDTQITAEDLDFAGDTGTGAVDLDSQTLTISGTANEVETSASGQTLAIGLPSTITANVTSTGTSTFSTIDVNGGAVDGTSVGASSASTGAFTTLSSTGEITAGDDIVLTNNFPVIRTDDNSEDLTLRGGVDDAGGQIKLNGSTAASANKIFYYGDEHEFWNTAVTQKIAFNGNEISFGSAQDVNLYRSGADALKTDDSLEVVGEFRVNGGGTGSIVVNDEDSSLCPTMTFLRNGGGTTGNDFIKFENSGGEVAAINSTGGGYFSGNVGIGTTPSNTLHVKNTTSSGAYINYDGQSNTEFGLRIESNAAGGNFEGDFANNGSLLDLFANSSTTTGGDILACRTQSATPVMLVRGNGNVGIGTASPQTNLDVSGSASSDIGLQIRAGDAGGQDSTQIAFSYNGSPYNSSGYAHNIRTQHSGSGEADNKISFYLWDFGTDTSSTLGSKHVMSLCGNGNVGIGDASPSYKLDVNGTFRTTDDIYNNISGTQSSLPGYYKGTYGAQIESAGTGSTLHIARSTGNCMNIGADSNATVVYFRDTSAGTTVATEVGSISITSSATAFNTSSDYRLKENEVSITDGIDRLKQLSPYRFNFKVDPDKIVDGFFAHEVSDVVPEAIRGEKDGMKDEEYEVSPAVYEDVVHPAVEAVYDEDGNELTPAVEEWTESVLVTEAVRDTRSVPDYQGIDQSKLVPLLTAALQEAVAKIEALEARVQTLEG